MKRSYFLLLLAALICTANFSYAAFVPKTHAPIVVTAPTAGTSDAAPTPQANEATEASIAQPTEHKAEKQSFFKRLIKKAKDVIPMPLYIVMAIFFLGWLAMGINDNFEGFDWVISLILYVLLWLPGVIYTLIKMGKYY